MSKRSIVPKCIHCDHFLAGSYCGDDFHVICKKKGDVILFVPVQCAEFAEGEE